MDNLDRALPSSSGREHFGVHAQTNASRSLEMYRSGRAVLYQELSALLPDKVRQGFLLVNFAVTNVDDLVDESENDEILSRATTLLTQSFQGETVECSEPWQQDIQALGKIFKDLKNEGFLRSQEIYEEVLKVWQVEKEDRNRRGSIIDREKLNSFNEMIGSAPAVEYLYLCCPTIPSSEIKALARSAGLAVKTADNLSDLEGDLKAGLINIAREDFEQFGLRMENHHGETVIQGDLDAYKASELSKAEGLYKVADEKFEQVIADHPECQKELDLLRKIFHTWLAQTREISATSN
jgi:hypothetical protein